MQKSITLNFSGHEFTITSTAKGFDLNDLRRQVAEFIGKNPEPTKSSSAFKSTKSLNDWSKYLSDKAKGFYQIHTVRGGNDRGATYSNESGLYAYSGWLNEDFGFAIMEVFKHAANGDGDKAVEEARKVARAKGKVTRRGWTDNLVPYGFEGRDFSKGTDTNYDIILDKTTSELKDYYGLGKNGKVRDHFPVAAVLAVGAAEANQAFELFMNPEKTKEKAFCIIQEQARQVRMKVDQVAPNGLI